MTVKLYYNFQNFYDEVFRENQRFAGDKEYRSTSLIRWLEENIEPMERRESGAFISGKTNKWTLKNNLEERLIEYTHNYPAINRVNHWVEVDDGILTEKQQFEFLLRFG